MHRVVAPFEPWSLLALLEAAALSPTAAHRGPSLGVLWQAAAAHAGGAALSGRRAAGAGHQHRPATAADLPGLLDSMREVAPNIAHAEDLWPADPRLVVRALPGWRPEPHGTAGHDRLRVLPGLVEHPMRLLRELHLTAASINAAIDASEAANDDSPDSDASGNPRAHRGLVRPAAAVELALRLTDRAATGFQRRLADRPTARTRSAPGRDRRMTHTKRPTRSPAFPAAVTDDEVAASAELLEEFRDGRGWNLLLDRCTSPADVRAARDALTLPAAHWRPRWGYRHPPFGAAAAIDSPLGLLPVPAAFALAGLPSQVQLLTDPPTADMTDALYTYSCLRAMELFNGAGRPLWTRPTDEEVADENNPPPWMLPAALRVAERHVVLVDVVTGWTARRCRGGRRRGHAAHQRRDHQRLLRLPPRRGPGRITARPHPHLRTGHEPPRQTPASTADAP